MRIRQRKPKFGIQDLEQIYWHEIRDSEPLGREAEEALARRARQGDEEAAQQLAMANLRFVVQIARGFAGCGLSLLELVSEGNLGLMEAARRYDERHGTKFITYAVWWIRQSILKALAQQKRTVRPPMSQVSDLRKVDIEGERLFQKFGREPSLEELAASAEISEDRARNALEVGYQDLSLDAPFNRDGDESLLSRFAGEAAGVDEALMAAEQVERLRECMASLGDRKRWVISVYFGLDGREPMTLEEIGAVLGVTRERMRQLRNQALEKLRQRLNAEQVEISPN